MGKVEDGDKLREKMGRRKGIIITVDWGAKIQEIVPRFYNRRKEEQLTS